MLSLPFRKKFSVKLLFLFPLFSLNEIQFHNEKKTKEIKDFVCVEMLLIRLFFLFPLYLLTKYNFTKRKEAKEIMSLVYNNLFGSGLTSSGHACQKA
jgi:hypothetical protein